MVDEEILESTCNTECLRYAAGTCPYLMAEKEDCPRIKDFIRAIYDLAIPESSGMTAKEFLGDERLSYLTWKNIVKFRFDVSYDAFENVIKIVGNMYEETRELTCRISLSHKDWDDLERYAANEGKSFQEYIDGHIKLALLTALREGYVIDAFRDSTSSSD